MHELIWKAFSVYVQENAWNIDKLVNLIAQRKKKRFRVVIMIAHLESGAVT